jgi:hypothetical protein
MIVMQQLMGGRAQNLLRQTKAWGLDSAKLAQLLYQSWRVHPKPLTLLLHDHLENPVAVKLLSVHKEYNLLRYYGFRGYLQNRRNAVAAIKSESAASSSSIAAKDAAAAPSSTQSVARISFMVTARMKEELVKDLGYSPEFITKLKPVEASLLLQHQVRDASPETLAHLVQVHEEEQEVAARKRQEEIDTEQRILTEQSQPAPEALSSEVESTNVSSESMVQTKDEESKPSSLSNHDSPNTFYGSSSSTPLAVATATNSGGRVWYELVERAVPESGEEEEEAVVMGLYTTEKDALEGLEAHQFLAERNRRPAGNWEVRKTVR